LPRKITTKKLKNSWRALCKRKKKKANKKMFKKPKLKFRFPKLSKLLSPIKLISLVNLFNPTKLINLIRLVKLTKKRKKRSTKKGKEKTLKRNLQKCSISLFTPIMMVIPKSYPSKNSKNLNCNTRILHLYWWTLIMV